MLAVDEVEKSVPPSVASRPPRSVVDDQVKLLIVSASAILFPAGPAVEAVMVTPRVPEALAETPTKAPQLEVFMRVMSREASVVSVLLLAKLPEREGEPVVQTLVAPDVKALNVIESVPFVMVTV